MYPGVFFEKEIANRKITCVTTHTSSGVRIDCDCLKHGKHPALLVHFAGQSYEHATCLQCYREVFPELGDAIKGEKERIPVDVCSYPGCFTTVEYHDTCQFCNKPICHEHSDNSYICFACLQDEATQTGRPHHDRSS